MNKKRRTSLEMRRDVLYVLEKYGGRVIKTHLLQKANLSSQYLNKQIGVLLLDGVIKEHRVIKKCRPRISYSLTEKGYKEVQTWKSLEQKGKKPTYKVLRENNNGDIEWEISG